MGRETGSVDRLDDMTDTEPEVEFVDTERVTVASGSGTAADADDSAEIEATRAQIEQTRAEMGQTIDAIKGKLNPQHLMEQAKETVRDATIGRAQQAASAAVDTAKEAVSQAGQTARGASTMIVDTIRENPIPAALAGIGLGWLWMSARQQKDGYGRYRETRSYAEYPSQYDDLRTVRPSADDTRHQNSSRVAEMAGQVQEKFGEVTGRVQETAGEVAGRVQEKVGRVANQAQYQAHRATLGFEQMLSENPLAVGAVALALGACVGLAVPETRQENRIMGEARDTLVEKAQQAAQNVAEKVQNVAQEAMGTAREEARSQGLTG